MSGSDVIVIGGGVIGLATARDLAMRGARVTVLERDQPGAHATRAAGGMLAPLSEAGRAGPFLELSLVAFAEYPAFVEGIESDAGVDVGFRREGKLEIALNEEQAGTLRQQFALRQGGGHDVELLDAESARELEPALSPRLVAAVYVRDDHQVDNRRLGRALWIAACRHGVRVRTGSRVTRILSEGAGARPHVRGVRLASGEVLAADAVVLAAGCWSGQLEGLPRHLPVQPVRGQMLAVDTVPAALRRVILTPGCYLIPRADGRILLGATIEPNAGFACHPTPAGVASLVSRGVAAVPALAEAPLVETWAGLRPGTPDDLPILGPDPALDRLIYATGHYRNGILLAPATARIVADLLDRGRATIPLDPFGPQRFDAST